MSVYDATTSWKLQVVMEKEAAARRNGPGKSKHCSGSVPTEESVFGVPATTTSLV
jgi:hypothetical protein